MTSTSMFTVVMKSRVQVVIISVTATLLLVSSVNATTPPPAAPFQPAGGNLPSCLINCRLRVISCASGCRYAAGPFPFYIRFCIGQCAVQNFRCIQSCVNPSTPTTPPILPPIFHRPPRRPILPPIFHRPPGQPILPPIFHRPPRRPILPPIFHRPPAEPISPPITTPVVLSSLMPKSLSVVQSTETHDPQPPLAAPLQASAPDHDHHAGKSN